MSGLQKFQNQYSSSNLVFQKLIQWTLGFQLSHSKIKVSSLFKLNQYRLYAINRCLLPKNRGYPLIRVYGNNEGKDRSYKPRNRSLQEYFLSHFISPTAHFQITKQNYQNWLLIFHPIVVQTWRGLQNRLSCSFFCMYR